MPDDQPNTDQRPSNSPGSETAKTDSPFAETVAPEATDTNSDFDYSDGVIDSPLGRYEIKKLLGRGGMGSVYLAHDTQLDRSVALKVPKFDADANPKSIERFYREARSAANLSHPNLCQVFDVGETNGTHYIAMAFIKGRPLSDYVRDGKPTATRAAAGTIRKVALAMHEAHESGIIHRDLKPANIMVDHRNEPIVMDFGLAVAHENDAESRLTQDGALLGSPAYMPPEQLQGNLDALGPTSDVYALGVVLYELLSGKLPYDGSGSTIAMIGQILTKQPTALAEARSDVEPALIQICERAMEKDPSDRYQSMKLFAEDLAAFLKSRPGESPKLSAKSTAQKSPAKKSSDTAATPDGSKPLSEQKTQQVTLAQVQLNERAKLAKTLCDSGEYKAALPILQQILSTSGAESTKEFAYAKTMLPKAQQQSAAKPAVAPIATPAPVDDPFANLPDTAATTGTPAYMQPPPNRKKRGKKASAIPKQKILLGAVVILSVIVVGFVVSKLIGKRTARENQINRTTTDGSAPVSPETSEPVSSSPVTAKTDATDSQIDDSFSPRPGGKPNKGFAKDDPDRPGKRGFDRVRGRIEDHIADFDSDGDGELELSAVPFPLRTLMQNGDTNDDGILDRNELDAMRRAERQRREGGGGGGGNGFGDNRKPGERGPGGPGPGPGQRGREGSDRPPRDF